MYINSINPQNNPKRELLLLFPFLGRETEDHNTPRRLVILNYFREQRKLRICQGEGQ